ncbi:MAG: D-alanyl-D-alanine carboxypeptidase family protein [Waddliaceae bacterium]
MKHLLFMVILPLLLSGGKGEAKLLDAVVSAESAILINADTGAVLYEKNARQLQFPASLTKIATAAYTLSIKGGDLDEMIVADRDVFASISEEKIRRSNYTLPSHWLDQKATHIGIKAGEELSLRDLLHGMLIASGADASNVIAKHVGGSISTFMEGMNHYLQELGCRQTVLTNPHGLHHPNQQTTAYEMAQITREALNNPTFREIVKKTQAARPQTNMQKATTLVQSNKLLRQGKYYYSKAIGVKTGYTSDAQYTFVGAAKDRERTLIAVLLKCEKREERFKDAKKLFELAFSETKRRRTLLNSGRQAPTLTLPGAAKPLEGYIEHDVVIESYPAEEPEISCFLSWNRVEIPVKKGQQVGQLTIEDREGSILRTEPLLAAEDVSFSWHHRLTQWVGAYPYLKLLAAGIFSCFFLLRFRIRK